MRIGFAGPGASHYISRLVWESSRAEVISRGADFCLLTPGMHIRLGVTAPIDDPPFLFARDDVVDGLIVFSSAISSAPRAEEIRQVLLRIGVPVVSIGFDLDDVPSVTADCSPGIFALVDHLVDLHGANRFGVIGGPEGHWESEARIGAFRSALEKRGIPLEEERITYGDFSAAAGIRGVTRLIVERDLAVDAIFTANDTEANGAIRALQRLGHRVPQDVMVVGYDDSPWEQIAHPLPTTVRHPFREMGAEAARMLFRLLDGESAASRSFPTVAVIRESCGCEQHASPRTDLANRPDLDLVEERAMRLGTEHRTSNELRLHRYMDGVASIDEVTETLGQYLSELGIGGYHLVEGNPGRECRVIASTLRERTPGDVESREHLIAAIREIGENAALSDVLVVTPLVFSSGFIGMGIVAVEFDYVATVDTVASALGGFLHRVSLMREIEARESFRRQSVDRLVATESRLAESERLATLGRLVTDMAHELNTPIGVAKTAASFLRNRVTGGDGEHDGSKPTSLSDAPGDVAAVDLIQRSLERLVNLVDRVRAVAPVRSFEDQKALDLSEVITTITGTLRPELDRASISLGLDLVPGVEVRLPVSTVTEMLYTLLTNCVDHGVRDIPSGRVVVTTSANEDGSVAMVVSDNGRGVDENLLSRLVEPFFTTERARGHVGLGLYGLHNAVANFGGVMRIRSSRDGGFDVEVVIPGHLVERHSGNSTMR